MVAGGRVIRAAAIAAGLFSTGILVGAGVLWAIVELDDGRHDIFGSESRSADTPVQPPRLYLVR